LIGERVDLPSTRVASGATNPNEDGPDERLAAFEDSIRPGAG
jgi:hypothetical protein